MQINLVITLLTFSIILMLLTTHVLRKGRISEKYSLLWYAMSIIIFILGLIPNIFEYIANLLGFETISNLVIACIIALILLYMMALTIICSGQRKKITMLIQELSLLKKEVRENEK